MRDADAEVDALLDAKQQSVLGERERWVERPAAEVEGEQAIRPEQLEETYGEGAQTSGAESGATPQDAGVDDAASDTPDDPMSGEGSGVPSTPAPAPTSGGATGGFLPDGASTTQPQDAAAASEAVEVREIGLSDALAAAFSTGREYQDQVESLYLAGLSLTGTRFQFGPQIDSSLAYNLTDEEGGRRRYTAGFDVGVSQILPTGGTLSLGFGMDTSKTQGPYLITPAKPVLDSNGDPVLDGNGDPLVTPAVVDEDRGRTYSSALTLSLSQPLARGSGYEVSHESLVQGERSLVYAIRSFELFRQDQAIAIARDFFQLVSRATQIKNSEESYRGAVFDRQKAEALRLVDRNTIEDVFRARRREVSEESDLLQSKADYEDTLDAFRIRLGLPDDVKIRIAPEDPPFEPVRIDPDSAVEVAMHNRLDLMTARQRLEDTERGVRIARDGLRTNVALGADYTLSGAAGNDFDNAGPDIWSAAASLKVDLPLQQTPERNAYRSALIDLDQARRDHELLLENVERDLRDSLRQLRRSELQVVLQQQQIEQELRAVAVTEIRVESGDADNRDLLEARQALVDLQNQLVSQKVSHFIARLSLMRDLGLLFIDDQGMWKP
ncbi:MAG: TolC family protein [Planctomycetes bacterium]|nr:TolC family protein [Planctomycetota bacterium]